MEVSSQHLDQLIEKINKLMDIYTLNEEQKLMMPSTPRCHLLPQMLTAPYVMAQPVVVEQMLWVQELLVLSFSFFGDDKCAVQV